MDPTDAKDGFDLLEYPCEFMFKAMCRRREGEQASEIIANSIRQTVAEKSILSSKSNLSRTGKFESVSTVVQLQSREQLEEIYQNIAALEIVMMTL